MKKKSIFLKDIMTKNVVTVAPTLSIREIAKVMERDGVSGVAVISPERGVVGIVTECDILHRFGKDNWELLTAEEIMTPNIEAIMTDTTLEQAADLMQKKNIHRLLVMDRSLSEPQMPAGIVSACDIVKEIGKGVA